MNIYWDIGNRVFLKALQNSQAWQKWENWVLRDVFEVRLYLVTLDEDTQTYSQQEAPSGWAPKFEIKASDALSGDPLVAQYTWVKNGSGASAYYTADINLNTEQLIGDMSTDLTNDYIAEFTLQDANSRNQDSTQIDVTIIADVIRSGTADPVSAQENYPWAQWVTIDGVKCLRLLNEDGDTLTTIKPAGAEL